METNNLFSKLSNLFYTHQIFLQETENGFCGCCPVHNGDNPSAFRIYLDGRQNWICFTQHCEQKYGNKISDLIKALNILIVPEEINLDVPILEHKIIEYVPPDINRQEIRSRLIIPDPYFLKRGISSYVLNKYDVGLCTKPKARMFNRSVVPVYDENAKYVGCIGRSNYEQCFKCYSYHPGLFCPKNPSWFPKWKANKGFKKKNVFYNYYNIKEKIKGKPLLVVESPISIWKLYEAGIFNCVAIFGCYPKLSRKQFALIKESEPSQILVSYDNDESGVGKSNEKQMIEWLLKHNLRAEGFNIDNRFNDIGNMDTSTLYKTFCGVIQ